MTASLTRAMPAMFVSLWSTGFIGARYAMPWSEPFTFLACRFALSAILLAGIAALVLRRRLASPAAGHAVLAGALIHGVYLGGVFWAIHEGMPAGLTALIIGLQPLVTAILAGAFLGERILSRHWAGLCVGLAGVAIVLAPDLARVATGVRLSTCLASLVAVLAISAGTVWQKRFVAKGDLVTTTMWQYVGAALVVTAGSLAFEHQRVTLNAQTVFAMAWLVLVLSIGAVFLLMLLIRRGEVVRVASLFYLVPPVTAAMAWALFGESLSPLQLGGMAVAALGVALATAQPETRLRASL